MGRRACCAKEGVKRGAWTSKEDDALAAYVKAHGEGKWREVPQKAGRLPGRTDNEIKNYWNSTLGRRAGAGGSSRVVVAPDTGSHATPAATSGTCEIGQKGAAPRADPDSAGTTTTSAAAVWAPKAVRCTGGLFFFHRDTTPAHAGETATPTMAGGGGGGGGEAGSSEDCSSAASVSPRVGSHDEPCFSGDGDGDWMDDVRALASFLESDEDWLRCQTAGQLA
ncbi:Anthocyanin regulatory C1 protein [Zea mays]|uniref:Anthocyanin regulatory C1 protein n=1 Tax=Zea mays TaxID=4577 RepID=A0A3L6DAF0_MAIZE|nr:Anthocyanin regulatory C1 protein [Zea mays]